MSTSHSVNSELRTRVSATVGDPELPRRARGVRGLCPRYLAPSLASITPALLTRLGIRAVILDLDNTLVTWHGEEIAAEVERWVGALRAARIEICIASNTHRPDRLRRLAERLEVRYATGVAKPRRAGLRRALGVTGARAEEAALIGDQVLTDIWGGNRCDLLTILVPPISPREFAGTRWISRPIERWLLAHFERSGWLEALPGEDTNDD
jgi:HAD superfamily phosphatase (TIGR01668 family)